VRIIAGDVVLCFTYNLYLIFEHISQEFDYVAVYENKYPFEGRQVLVSKGGQRVL